MDFPIIKRKISEIRYFGTGVERRLNLGSVTPDVLSKQIGSADKILTVPKRAKQITSTIRGSMSSASSSAVTKSRPRQPKSQITQKRPPGPFFHRQLLRRSLQYMGVQKGEQCEVIRHPLTYGICTVFIIALGLLSRTAYITALLPGIINAYLGDALWAAMILQDSGFSFGTSGRKQPHF